MKILEATQGKPVDSKPQEVAQNTLVAIDNLAHSIEKSQASYQETAEAIKTELTSAVEVLNKLASQPSADEIQKNTAAALEQIFSAYATSFNPQITIPEIKAPELPAIETNAIEDVLETQLRQLSQDVQEIVAAFEGVDLSKVERELEAINKKLQKLIDSRGGGSIVLGGGGGGSSFINEAGQPTQVLLNPDGSLPVINEARWGIARLDPTPLEPFYYGLEDKQGNWYIIQEMESTGEWLYYTGAGTLAAAWPNRSGFTYVERSEAL